MAEPLGSILTSFPRLDDFSSEYWLDSKSVCQWGLHFGLKNYTRFENVFQKKKKKLSKTSYQRNPFVLFD